MTVMMSVMTGLPVAISQEKEVGTLDGMMVAPINRLSIILGKDSRPDCERSASRSHNTGVGCRSLPCCNSRKHPARVRACYF